MGLYSLSGRQELPRSAAPNYSHSTMASNHRRRVCFQDPGVSVRAKKSIDSIERRKERVRSNPSSTRRARNVDCGVEKR